MNDDEGLRLEYAAERTTLLERLRRFARQRKRVLIVTACVCTVLLIAAPIALVQYGKYQWNTALANTSGPGRGCVVQFDGFLLGRDHLVHGWGVRYRMGPPGAKEGFEAYFFIWPWVFAMDAPIFHS